MDVAIEILKIAKDILSEDFPSGDALKKYLKEHPDADRRNHRVVKTEKNPVKIEEEEGAFRIPDKSSGEGEPEKLDSSNRSSWAKTPYKAFVDSNKRVKIRGDLIYWKEIGKRGALKNWTKKAKRFLKGKMLTPSAFGMGGYRPRSELLKIEKRSSGDDFKYYAYMKAPYYVSKYQYQQITGKKFTHNKDTFHGSTTAYFKPSEAPNREPDFESSSGSEYWYSDKGVHRRSDHWGKGIASCDWYYDGKEDKGQRVGFSRWDNFK